VAAKLRRAMHRARSRRRLNGAKTGQHEQNEGERGRVKTRPDLPAVLGGAHEGVPCSRPKREIKTEY
jgi:hypothetical protein